MNVRRILCPVDFSDSTETGLVTAAALAHELGAEMFFLHVIDFPYESVATEREYLEVEDAVSKRLDAIATRFAGAAESHRVILRGAAYERIVDFAREQNVDLIVMPTHGRYGLDRLLHGSVTERVARLAPCPVLAVPPTREAISEFAPRSILVATDFSSHADDALTIACSMASALGASLLIAHVATLANRGGSADWRLPALSDDTVARVSSDARSRLQERRERVQASGSVTVKARLLHGAYPAIELSALAESANAGMVVVGSHGHSAVRRALLGSLSEKLLRTCDVPLLIARTPAD